jgi:hypothetical protein
MEPIDAQSVDDPAPLEGFDPETGAASDIDDRSGRKLRQKQGYHHIGGGGGSALTGRVEAPRIWSGHGCFPFE